jgi:GntR family transcriptional regulator/MocR family aminotransferase
MLHSEQNPLSSRTLELLVPLTRGGARTLGTQIESQIRDAIRTGRLRPGAPMPSTRDLARQLGVSRPLVVDAYGQLAAEGYLTMRQGARPRVSPLAVTSKAAPIRPSIGEPTLKFDFRTCVPDLSSFPGARWLRAQRRALSNMRAADFGYSDPHGTAVLRVALADYLGRVRGVLADPDQIIVTSGFSQARVLVCRALSALGATRIAVENPGYPRLEPIRRTGLETIPITVDGQGMRIDELDRSGADAVAVTPTHHYPTGRSMSTERRLQLRDWLLERMTVALEDDYDAEFCYERPPRGAMHALAPDHIVYLGSASNMLVPGLRLAWLVAPAHLRESVQAEQQMLDLGCSRIEQHTLADFIASGELDRHLRRMRARYRARRDTIAALIAAELPEAQLDGLEAGLHATVRLPDDYDEREIRREMQRRGVAVDWMSDHYLDDRGGPPEMLLNYARESEPLLGEGVRALADAIRSSRASQLSGLLRAKYRWGQ